MSGSRSSSGGGFGALVLVLLLIAFIVKFIWWILGTAALIGLFFLGRAVAQSYARRSAEHARYRAAIAARADQQHNWVLQGDDRGIYGPEGAELMHYIYPVRGQVRRLNPRR
ncbi:MAG: hypothetical protein ACLQIK_10355 [Mycobacterium sp.]|uniref:hypothetical protein n=1 Tax=Mycobacterium sp. TaxID=1785 RepID=UPI002BADCAB0|nr:hypothetical protein [Mycobacterium sp.]